MAGRSRILQKKEKSSVLWMILPNMPPNMQNMVLRFFPLHSLIILNLKAWI